MKRSANTLEKYRKEIDKINNQMVRLLAKRLSLVKKIGAYKKKNGMKVYDRKREKIILEKLRIEAKRYLAEEKYIENFAK